MDGISTLSISETNIFPNPPSPPLSLKAANRCRDFIVKATMSHADELISPDNSLDVPDVCCASDLTTQKHRRVKVMDMEAEDIHAVVFPAMTGIAIEAKSYWQHTGEIVTSRRGECGGGEERREATSEGIQRSECGGRSDSQKDHMARSPHNAVLYDDSNPPYSSLRSSPQPLPPCKS